MTSWHYRRRSRRQYRYPHLVDAAVTFVNDVVVLMEGTRSGYFYKESFRLIGFYRITNDCMQMTTGAFDWMEAKRVYCVLSLSWSYAGWLPHPTKFWTLTKMFPFSIINWTWLLVTTTTSFLFSLSLKVDKMSMYKLSSLLMQIHFTRFYPSRRVNLLHLLILSLWYQIY